MQNAISLGVFPGNPHQFLASFADDGFKAGDTVLAGTFSPFRAHPPPPLKAGYTAPSFYQMQVFFLSSPMRSLHGYEGHARMPLRIAPIPLTPSDDPRLGVESRHQKLHRCALNGFLAPSSKLVGLTRILQPFASLYISNTLYHSRHSSFQYSQMGQ